MDEIQQSGEQENLLHAAYNSSSPTPSHNKRNVFLICVALIALFGAAILVNMVKKNNRANEPSTYQDESAETEIIKNQTDQTYSPIDFTETYSNGWYNYSFKYPKSAIITHSIGGINRESFSEEAEIPNKGISISFKPYSCALETAAIRWIEGDHREITSDYSSLLLNDISWKKKKYTSDGGSALYEYNGVIWQVNKDHFRYTISSNRDNEQWCETLVSTFQFTINPLNEGAQKAKLAKEAALQYAADKYSNKLFLQGFFLYNSKTQKLDVLDSTDKAKVTISDPTNVNFTNSVGIKLIDTNNQWMVVGEESPW